MLPDRERRRWQLPLFLRLYSLKQFPIPIYILLSASVSIAGMAVAFPLGVGLALVLGVFINYFSTPKGDPFWLFTGVILIVIAIICNGIAAGRQQKKGNNNSKKGIILAAIAGILMSFFYRFVAAAMDLNNFDSPTPGMATPYTAFFIFSIGIFLSNFLFNTVVMKRPFVGTPVSYKEYFAGKASTHLVGSDRPEEAIPDVLLA